MKCGLYETDITPLLGMNLPGYFVLRPATAVLDPLYAKAMALESGGETLLLIGVDILASPDRFCEMIRGRIRESADIPDEAIFICATHTHTGGPIKGSYSDLPGAEQPYLDFAAAKAADAAVQALNSMRTAKIGFGSGSESTISFVRRYIMRDGKVRTNPGFNNPDIVRPAGEIDPEVGVLRIDDADGNIIGVVTNFACHCDTVGGNKISADYPGELSRTLKRVYGQNLVSIFLFGACGNINHNDYMGESPALYNNPARPHHITMGRILAGEVIKVLERIHTAEDFPAIRTAICTAEGEIRRPDERQVREAEEYLAENPLRDYKIYEKGAAWPGSESYFASGLIEVARSNETTITVRMGVAMIGDIVLVGVPCEFFVEFGLEIKQRSGVRKIMIATQTNGYNGYVATPESFEQGGYEVRINSTTKLGPETGPRMTEAILAAIKGLQKE